ncbi:hypothetical protein V6N13_128196 [Hibiscus sabdariffa]|uniref:Uncharacterized protein n=1 Tax=Hibiscus sabdariffa TaxID=183260 RepID=A0ABR2P1G8_9ROSI
MELRGKGFLYFSDVLSGTQDLFGEGNDVSVNEKGGGWRSEAVQGAVTWPAKALWPMQGGSLRPGMWVQPLCPEGGVGTPLAFWTDCSRSSCLFRIQPEAWCTSGCLQEESQLQ